VPRHGASFCTQTPEAAAGGGGSPDTAALEARVAELKESLADLREKIARIKGEDAQQKKRHVTDLRNEKKYGPTKFAKEMIKVQDNFERATGSVTEDDLKQDGELRKLHAQVARVQDVMKDALETFEITKMEPMDQPFDPNKHEAMFTMAMPGKEENTVFHVLEPGYTIVERTLRAARVGIVRAP